MGNLIQSATPLELQKRYKVVKQGHQDLTLLQELETGNQYCLKCFMFNSNQGLEACVQKLNGKKRINHQHILAIKQIYNRSQNTFCSNIHKVYAIIQYPFRTMAQQITQRKRNWNYFSQTELWSIIYSCSMALNYLYSTNLTHGCLTSNRIYIQNDGLIKISDPSLFNQNTNMVGYMTNSNKQHVYISPQQIDKMSSNYSNDLAIESSDVFILGMIILQAIYLQGMEDVYDNGINYKVLSTRISEVDTRYSKQLRSILQRMLSNKVGQRISFQEIETIIQNNDFDQQDLQSQQSSRNSFSSRKPLDSIPSSVNVQNSRRNESRPSKNPYLITQKQLSINQNIQNTQNYQNVPNKSNQCHVNTKTNGENQIYSYQTYTLQPHVIQPQQISKNIHTQKITVYPPIHSINTHSPTYQQQYYVPQYPSINYYQVTSGSPTSQFTNSWNINQSVNNSKNSIQSNSMVYSKIPDLIKPMELPTYQTFTTLTKYPLQANPTFMQTPTISSSNYSGFQPNTLPSNILQPIKVEYKPQFITSLQNKFQNANINIPLQEYKYDPLILEKNSFNVSDSSPVQKLKSFDDVQETQKYPERKIMHDHPNSVIAEVTQTEISGVESPKREEQSDSLSQPQYVNQECSSGSHYEGYKLNGKKHGFGRLYYQDGGYYEGEWKFDKMNGFAKLYYQSGDIAYQGYWVNDKLHGKGKVFNDNPVDLDESFDFKDFTGLDDYWQFYDGQFAMDAKQGFGTIKLTNGQIFEGQFDKDVIQGRGKYYALNGKIINGIWRQNKLVQTSRQY